jgi:hypothetical protein
MFGFNDVQSYYVQFQDNSGWRNCMTMSASNGAERLQIAMCEAQRSYPGYRIRVVDEAGRLIDML